MGDTYYWWNKPFKNITAAQIYQMLMVITETNSGLPTVNLDSYLMSFVQHLDHAASTSSPAELLPEYYLYLKSVSNHYSVMNMFILQNMILFQKKMVDFLEKTSQS